MANCDYNLEKLNAVVLLNLLITKSKTYKKNLCV